MKRIRKIISNPFLVFILLIKDLIEIIIHIINSIPLISEYLKTSDMVLPIFEYDWFDFIIKLIIVIILLLVLSDVKRIKEEIKLRLKLMSILAESYNINISEEKLLKNFTIDELKKIGYSIPEETKRKIEQLMKNDRKTED